MTDLALSRELPYCNSFCEEANADKSHCDIEGGCLRWVGRDPEDVRREIQESNAKALAELREMGSVNE